MFANHVEIKYIKTHCLVVTLRLSK